MRTSLSHRRGTLISVPTSLEIDELLPLLRRETTLFGEMARSADPTAPVPTCPGWTMQDLVAHQAAVHRWATDVVSGRWDGTSSYDDLAGAAPSGAALLDWYDTGAQALVAALVAAPEDLEALVFLRDAPPPRLFWARRQLHETTIHRIDATAGAEQRTPLAAECGISVDHALDGLDELLVGNATRRKWPLRSTPAVRLAVAPVDNPRRWILTIGADQVTTTVGDGSADTTFRGTAAQLYLGLWNRGAEIAVTGDPTLLQQWRVQMRVL